MSKDLFQNFLKLRFLLVCSFTWLQINGIAGNEKGDVVIGNVTAKKELLALKKQAWTLDEKITERDQKISEKNAVIEELKKNVMELRSKLRNLEKEPLLPTNSKKGIPAESQEPKKDVQKKNWVNRCFDWLGSWFGSGK